MARNLYLKGHPDFEVFQDNFGMPDDAEFVFERDSQLTITPDGIGTISKWHKYKKTDEPPHTHKNKEYEVWEYVETITEEAAPGANLSAQVGSGQINQGHVTENTILNANNTEFPRPEIPKRDIKEAVEKDVEKG